MNKKQFFKEGVQAGIPIALGYFAVSFTFGMMSVANGLNASEAALISLTNLTSAGQFAGLDIIAASGSYVEMMMTQLVINLRYCLMSFSISQKLSREESWAHRYFVAYGITDEIFGVSAGYPGKISAFCSYGAMSVAVPGWVFGTIVGAVCGNILPAFVVSALSIAIYGMFLAVIIPPAKSDRAVMMVVIGAMAVSTAFSVIPILKGISSGFVIIIVTVLVSASAAYFAPIKEEGACDET